jgi:hypothetical protein
VYKAGALPIWAFYSSAPVAERSNERVAIGPYSLVCSGATSRVLEPEQIGEALNDAANLCLARLLK